VVVRLTTNARRRASLVFSKEARVGHVRHLAFRARMRSAKWSQCRNAARPPVLQPDTTTSVAFAKPRFISMSVMPPFSVLAAPVQPRRPRAGRR